MAAVIGSVGRAAAPRPRTTGRGRPTRSRSVGRPGEQPVDGVHGELVLDQLDEVGERGAGVAGVAVGRLPLGLVGERGLVAVVAVGDHHGLLGDRRGDGGARWRGRRPARRCGARRPRRRRRRAARRRTGSRSVRPLASDRPQIAERLARHERSRSSRSLLAFLVVCSWGRMSVPGGLSSRAPITPVVRRSTPSSSVEVMRYTREARPLVDHEGAVGEPGVRGGRGRSRSARRRRPRRGGRCARRCAGRGRPARRAAAASITS